MKTYFILLMLIPSIASTRMELDITPWKNGALGAYSIIHDDFCMYTSRGIGIHADTVARNRNLRISFATVTAHCDSQEWKSAKDMIHYGHEIHNHSHNHFCGLPVTWCPNNYYQRDDYQIEYDKSDSLIELHTGEPAQFYVFPYDLINDTMVDYVRNDLNYFGSRSGKQYALNHPDSISNFGVNFHLLRPEHSLKRLDSLVDEAIVKECWAVRGCHGVEDNSWGSIPLKDYVMHLNYLKQKVELNQVWVETPVRILRYTTARKNTKLVLSEDRIAVKYQGKDKGVELTLKYRYPKFLHFAQGGMPLKSWRKGEYIFVNFQPERGDIQIFQKGKK